MQKIYNEFGISLVLGKGNWIRFSHEVEDGDFEERGFGWKKLDKISDVYRRSGLGRYHFLIDIKIDF